MNSSFIGSTCVSLLFFLTLSAGCRSDARSKAADVAAASQTTNPLSRTKLAVEIPQSGTSSERVRRMWKETRAMIVKDAAANLTDEQYHAKRDPVFVSWTMFQEQLYPLNDSAVEQSKNVVPDILGVIDDLYGFGGEPEPRTETRETFKKAISARLEKVDAAVKALP
jgi:hypothetical protein